MVFGCLQDMDRVKENSRHNKNSGSKCSNKSFYVGCLQNKNVVEFCNWF